MESENDKEEIMKVGQTFCREKFNHYVHGEVKLEGVIVRIDGPRIELKQVQMTKQDGEMIEKPKSIVFI